MISSSELTLQAVHQDIEKELEHKRTHGFACRCVLDCSAISGAVEGDEGLVQPRAVSPSGFTIIPDIPIAKSISD